MLIIKNFLYNVGYQVFIILLPIITVPYVSRVLGSEGVGINAFTNSIIQYFVLLGSIGINLYGNRAIAYCRNDKRQMSKIFWEIAILRILSICVSYLLFLVFLFFTDTYKDYYLYQSLLIIAAAFDISWFFMGNEDFKKTIIRNSLVKLVSLLSIFIFVKQSTDLSIYILIMSLSMLFGNLTLWPYLRKSVYWIGFSELEVFKHLRPSISLFIPQIAIQVYLILNKTMLGIMDGVQSTGYYESSDKIVKIVLAVVTATGTVMLPRVANTYAQGNIKKVNDYLYKSFDFVSLLCFPMAFGLSAIAPKFSVWFLGKEFSITGNLISILSIVIIWIGWSNVLGTQYLLPTNKTKYYTFSVSAGAISNLSLNLLLIPMIGVYGAIIATVISEFVVTLVQLIYVNKFLCVSELFQEKWKYLLASIMMFVVVRYLNNTLSMNIINLGIQIIIGLILYGVIIILLKAKIINELKKILKGKVN